MVFGIVIGLWIAFHYLIFVSDFLSKKGEIKGLKNNLLYTFLGISFISSIIFILTFFIGAVTSGIGSIIKKIDSLLFDIILAYGFIITIYLIINSVRNNNRV